MPGTSFGRPFQKGVSGNPGGGRSKAANELAKKFRADTADGDELRTFVLNVMRGKEKGLEDAKSRRWAADVALERGWGKPQQHIEITTGEGAPRVDYSVLTDQELADLERITAKLQAGAVASAVVTIEAAGGDHGGSVH